MSGGWQRVHKVLITGAGGQLGRRICHQVRLAWPGATLVAIGGRAPCSGPSSGYSRTDLRDPDSLAGIGTDFDLVFHLAAALPGVDATAAQFDDNARMALNLTAVIPGWHTRQVVYSSSISVYAQRASPLCEAMLPEPLSHYGAGKLAGETLLGLLRPQGIRVACLRLSSLCGPGRTPDPVGTVFYRFAYLAAQGHDITLYGQGARTQDFLHVQDAAELFVRAAQQGLDGVYNAGAGHPTSMLELARTACQAAGRPESLLRFQPELPEGASVRLDTTKLMQTTGWTPRLPLFDAMRDTLGQ